MYYVAAITPSLDGFSVCFPDIPGCASGGDTFEDALRNGAEALSLHVGAMIVDGDDIPLPSSIEAAREKLETMMIEEGEDPDDGTVYAPIVFDVDDFLDEPLTRLVVRMKPGIARDIDLLSRELGLSRSDVLTVAAREFCIRMKEPRPPFVPDDPAE